MTVLVFHGWIDKNPIRTAGNLGKLSDLFCTSLCAHHPRTARQHGRTQQLPSNCSPTHMPSLKAQTRHSHHACTLEKCWLPNLHPMSNLTGVSDSSCCCPFDDNIQPNSLWAEEYNSNGFISWGRGAVMCQALSSTAHKPLVHRSRAYHFHVMPVRMREEVTGRQIEWGKEICVKEKGVGERVQLQVLSVVSLLSKKKRRRRKPHLTKLSAGCQGKCHRGGIKKPQMTPAKCSHLLHKWGAEAPSKPLTLSPEPALIPHFPFMNPTGH